MKIFLELYEMVPYEALHYCIGQANYGGRVTDDKDARTMGALLQDYIDPQVCCIEAHGGAMLSVMPY